MKKSFKILSIIFMFIIAMSTVTSTVFFANAKSSNYTLENVHNDCKSCILIEQNTGSVIYSKEPDKKLPIASMTKLVSLAVIFDAIDNGKLNLDQEITVSSNAASAEGSEAFLDANKRYRVEDLIKTVIISSANDSTIALAEAVAGSEDNFCKKMNVLASKLEMNNSHFANSTGLPTVDHYSTARDMTIIYNQISNNIIYKKFAKIWIDELIHSSGRKTGLVNTNRLIKSYSSCTGGKTGHTNEAGYCLTASAKRGDMDLVGVVIGGKDSKARFSSMTCMFDYGFNNFENRVIVKKDESISKALIKGSKEKEIEVYPSNDYVKFLQRGENFNYTTAIELYDIKAPIEKTDKLGVLMILDENNIVIEEIDLISNRRIEKIKLNEILDNIYINW